MIAIEKCTKALIVSLAIFLSLGISIAVASKPISIPDAATELRRLGYPCDTPEQIAAAYKSGRSYVRYLVVELLTERGGKEAMSTLKAALNDEDFELRWRAAHWLGTQGDKSGLDRMREDLSVFTKAINDLAPLSDPNQTADPNEIKIRAGKRNLDLYYGAVAARVLAELGDQRGYDLAVRVAFEGPRKTQRFEAVACLAEIATSDKDTLKAKRMDPISVLCAIAESERDTDVLTHLMICAKNKLDADTALQILKYARDAPNRSEEARKIIKTGIDDIEAKMRSGGNQKQPQNNR